MKRIVLISMLFAFAVSSYAQIIHADHGLEDFYRMKFVKEGYSNTKYDDIQGSPFLNKEFIKGELLMSDSTKYIGIPLRYNIYTDEIEYQGPDESEFALGDKTMAIKISFDNHEFKYISSSEVKSYLEFVVLGKATLLKKYKVRYVEAEKAKAYEKSMPARFERGTENYYIEFQDGKISYVPNNKNIASLFPDKKEEIEKYVKAEKLKLKKEDDLIKLINFYNKQ